MNMNTFHIEKFHQNQCSAINVQTQPDHYKIISLKVEIYDAKIKNNICTDELDLYIIITIGKDQRKTTMNNNTKGFNPMFNEMFEFKKITETRMNLSIYHKTFVFSKDKYIAGNVIDLTDPNILNITSCEILNQNQDNIGKLNIKIRGTEISKSPMMAKDIHKKKFHTDNTLITIQNPESSNNSLDLSNDFTQKMNRCDIQKLINQSNFPQELKADNNNHKADLIQKKMEYSSSNKSMPTRLTTKNTKNDSEDFDKITSADSETGTLKLDDIEKIKCDLNDEKNKIRRQEKHLNKLMQKFKRIKLKLEEEKRNIQKRKDYLTIQERSLLDEKNRLNEQLNSFKEEKNSHNEEKQGFLNEIETAEQNMITIRFKNSIHAQKLNNLLKSLPDIKARKSYIISQCNASTRLKKANLTFRKNLNHIPEFGNTERCYYDLGKRSSSQMGLYNNNGPFNKKYLYTKSRSVEIIREKVQIKNENLIFELKAEKNKIMMLINQLTDMDALESELEHKVCEKMMNKVTGNESSLRIIRNIELKPKIQYNIEPKTKKNLTKSNNNTNNLEKKSNETKTLKVTDLKMNYNTIKPEYGLIIEKNKNEKDNNSSNNMLAPVQNAVNSNINAPLSDTIEYTFKKARYEDKTLNMNTDLFNVTMTPSDSNDKLLKYDAMNDMKFKLKCDPSLSSNNGMGQSFMSNETNFNNNIYMVNKAKEVDGNTTIKKCSKSRNNHTDMTRIVGRIQKSQLQI